jgi:hypothetical protein
MIFHSDTETRLTVPPVIESLRAASRHNLSFSGFIPRSTDVPPMIETPSHQPSPHTASHDGSPSFFDVPSEVETDHQVFSEDCGPTSLLHASKKMNTMARSSLVFLVIRPSLLEGQSHPIGGIRGFGGWTG